MQVSVYATIEERALCACVNAVQSIRVPSIKPPAFHPLYRRQKVGGITFIRILSWQFSYCRTFKPARPLKRKG